MKRVRLLGCGIVGVALLFILGLSAYIPAHVLATDMPVIGGLNPPGEVERFECPKGSYLVGLKGKHGDWIDRLAPVCAPWLPAEQRFGKTVVGPLFGNSLGGNETPTRVCWSSGVRNLAVQSWRYYFQYLKTPRHYVLSFIQAHCVSLSPRAETGKLMFGPLPYIVWPKQGPFEGPPPNQACPPGEIAVGIRARTDIYNEFIYGIGLICGPPPSLGEIATQVNPLAVKPDIATKVNPLAETPVSDDMFVIMKPAANDPVLPGQLVLLVKPPKRGVPPVTVLEFRWLDAPPGQAGSYRIAVETPKLLQNYLVPPQSTPNTPGRWEVRARTAAQPTPGPWSLPVKFNVVSAVQQTAPLPSSSVTAPASPVQQIAPPPSSAPAQMNRSPFMITPRGVEEKGGNERNQTIDQPPDTEQKP